MLLLCTLILTFISISHCSLFKTKIVPIDGQPGDYYVISARAEDPFQSLEMDLVCSPDDLIVFAVRIDNCVPRVNSEEQWHFYYDCDLKVHSVEDGQLTQKHVVRTDPKFAYRRDFLLSIGIEDDKYMLWNGDRARPLVSDVFLRFMGKAEMKMNTTCTPDQLIVKGTVWKLDVKFIRGKIPVPQTSESPTTTTVPSKSTLVTSSGEIEEGSGEEKEVQKVDGEVTEKTNEIVDHTETTEKPGEVRDNTTRGESTDTTTTVPNTSIDIIIDDDKESWRYL